MNTKTAETRVVTVEMLRETFDAFTEEAATGIADVLKPMLARLAALEARPRLKWGGTFVEGAAYDEAQLVTRGGSLWVSTAATKSTPGTAGSDWKLIVKKGAT